MEDSNILCCHTHMVINNYELNDYPELEHTLSIFDKVYHEFIPKGYVYDSEEKKLYLPSGIGSSLLGRLMERPIDQKYKPDPYNKIDINMTASPRNQLQEEALDFLLANGKYKRNAPYTQFVLNLNTGEGKTYAGIAYIGLKKLRSLIIINTSKIKDQWEKCFLKYTDIKESEILEIKGSNQCIDIIERSKAYDKYKVFIVSHDTLRSLGNTYSWHAVTDLFIRLKVGIKIYDEAHLEFSNIIRVDCATDTKYTLYLTATFGRSEIKENYIFNYCFRNVPKYEQKRNKDYEGKRYINYIVKFYRTNPTLIQHDQMKNKYGFDRNRYAKYQLTNDQYFMHIIKSFVQKFTSENKYKTLILMTTINGIEDLTDALSYWFPNLKITNYHSKMSSTDKDKAIEGDIIISTIKSLGVGADIPDLRVVINTEAFKSAILTEQLVGRLRKIDDDTKCYYLEMVDRAFQTLRAQQKEREKILINTVKIGGIYHIPEDVNI